MSSRVFRACSVPSRRGVSPTRLDWLRVGSMLTLSIQSTVSEAGAHRWHATPGDGPAEVVDRPCVARSTPMISTGSSRASPPTTATRRPHIPTGGSPAGTRSAATGPQIFAAVPDLRADVSAVQRRRRRWLDRVGAPRHATDGSPTSCGASSIFGVADGLATWARFYLEPVHDASIDRRPRRRSPVRPGSAVVILVAGGSGRLGAQSSYVGCSIAAPPCACSPATRARAELVGPRCGGRRSATFGIRAPWLGPAVAGADVVVSAVHGFAGPGRCRQPLSTATETQPDRRREPRGRGMS